MPTLRLFLLGSLDIRHDDQQVSKPPTLKSQSLLAYLVFHRHQPQPRERLVDLFWGDRPERRARRSLTTALWHIRRCLPEDGLILSELDTVQFDPRSELWLDIDEFQALASRQDIASLQAAVSLYRGSFLDSFYDDWILTERYRFENLLSEALARLMSSQETRGDHEAALSVAARLLEQDPLREDAYRVAMRAYWRLGRRNEALGQYHRCRQVVKEELSVEPMAETTELYQQILDGRFTAEHVAEATPLEMPSSRAAPAPGRDPLDVATRTKLVGREEELAFLQDHWQVAEAGWAGLVLISGEAGVGKTRLVEEFARSLDGQGARVLWGRCYEFERSLPYQPVADALRTILPNLASSELSGLPAGIVAEIARLVPEVLEKRPELENTDAFASDQEQARLFGATARFLAELSTSWPLLLILEDLQWAGESTLQLLHYLAHHLTSHRVLMIGTFRLEEMELHHLVLDLQRRLTRERLAESLQLSRLPPAAAEAMVVEMSGAGEAAIPLAERLYRETEGNPFFLIETAKSLFEMGVIRLEGGRWTGDFSQIHHRPLPLTAGVSELIQARARRLNGDTQEALRIAAVLGREFDFDLLCAVWGRTEDATLEALDDLLHHRLIDEGLGTAARDYAFTHHKIQEAIYAGMPGRRRHQAHAQVGMAMERLYAAKAEGLAGELAFHFREGMKHDKALAEKAIEYLLRAGDQTRVAYAHQEAIDYYQQALRLLTERRAYERAARTLMTLGLTHHNAFQFQQARQAYEEGFTLWQQASWMEPLMTPPPVPHALRVALNYPLTLDPNLAADNISSTLTDQLFCGLVELTPQMGIEPDMARSWEVSEGGLRYIFHLRDDTIWSDGVPVTAADFEYAWKRVLDPATSSANAGLLYDVAGARAFHQGEGRRADVAVKAIDELTLVVELEAPTGYFLQLLAHNATFPVPPHVVQAYGKSWSEAGRIVTNGPFHLASWRRDESIVLTSNPEYHGRRRGNVDRVEFALVPGGAWSTSLAMYEANNLDVLNLRGFPPRERGLIRQRLPAEYVSEPELSVIYTGFRVDQPPFDEVRVRQAFVLATDRERLADVVLGGDYSPATGGFVPPGMPGCSAGIGLPYDPDQARDLLAEAGYPGGRGFPAVEALAFGASNAYNEYVEAQWRENLGVDIIWEFVDWATLLDRLDREPPHLFGLGEGAYYPDPDSVLRASSVRHHTRWQNPTYDGLVEKAKRIPDQAERMKLYAQADRILVQEAVILPLTYGRHHQLVKPWVTRFPTSAMNKMLLFSKDVIIEPH